MKPVFVSAGCMRRPHVLARLGECMVYGSRSNVVVADENRVVDVMYLDNNVNVVACGHGMILAGDCEGGGYVVGGSAAKVELGAAVEAAGFLDDGRVVFCTADCLFVYEAERQQMIHKIKSECMPTCVLGAGGRLFVGTRRGCIVVVDTAGFGAVCEVSAHEDSIQDMKAVELEGSVYIATCSQDETVKIWRLVDSPEVLQHVQTLNGHTDWIHGVCWTERGDLLSASADCSIVYWTRGKVWESTMRLGGHKAFFGVLMLGRAVIGQSYSGGFYKFEDELKHHISGHTDEIRSIDWRGEFVLTASLDMTSRMFYKGQEAGRPQIHGYPLTSARFLNEDNLSFIGSAQETILRIYEPTQAFYMSCIYIETNTDDPTASLEMLRISDDRKSLYDFFSSIGDLKLAAVPAELSLTNEVVDDFEFETLNEQLLSTTTFHEARKIYGHYFEISDVAVSRDLIVSCNKSLLRNFSGIFVWSRSFELVQYIEEHDYGIQRLAFSPDGRFLAAASKDRTASVYEVGKSIRLVQRLRDHRRVVWDCSFSHDSRYLATCSRDKSVFVYEAPGFARKFSMRLECEVSAVCFSPTRPMMLLGLESGEVVVVDVGYELTVRSRSREHSRQVNVIRFSEDGSRYATGGADGMLKIFLLN